ncbi:alkaline D-peptidase [Kordiimonas sediminis]|uniref:Alkaline D-peptidase n=1 Tax=Kordiimonas sediminis TaxID=1735581 RepID=A0A919AR24_9PROT|nr:serine hydrolase domain-containing protein [Kordiimonas sediminis]GHF17832.1 alkaline D-peptidase [Kordiimonas sediminis]
MLGFAKYNRFGVALRMGVSAGMLILSSQVVADQATEYPAAFSKAVDKIFAPFDRTDAPGCAVGVMKDGEFLHKGAYGMASLELGVPLTPDSVFRIASVSKQFTAAAVLLLADDGVIDLDEDIRRYLPDLPDYAHTVTVRSMLGHTSGMSRYDHISGSYEGEKQPSAVDLRSPLGRPFRLGNEDYLTNDEFYDVVKKLGLIHEPDTRFEYNNVAYFLLSKLVEKVSGKTLRTFADERIFGPLGMSETFYSDDAVEIIKNRAQGYKPKEGGGYINDMTNLFVVGDGGVHTSINDFIKWDRNFIDPKLGKDPAAFKALMNTPTSQHKARGALYAYGQFRIETDSNVRYEHSGGWLGFTSYYRRIEDEGFSLVTLCNNAQQEGLYEAIDAVVDLYFSDKPAG